MSKNFYASVDSDGMREFWNGKPIWDRRLGIWKMGHSTASHLLSEQDIEDCMVARAIMEAIWPDGIKPGECKEVRLPKLEIV